MVTLKIYLETTLFNFYFDTDRDAHPDTVKLFTEIAEGKNADSKVTNGRFS